MQIDKRSRTELKQYFVKNAIPTESNFAELIDGMLNQRDDGIAKLPNDPLSIEAAGDDTSQKKAIHFYGNFSDASPTWVLSLNPRQNPADPKTAEPGFSISDADGISRLFISRDTGNVGVGTITPSEALQVAGSVKANRFTSDNTLVLNDYTTPNPSSNVYLYSPPNDRDAWLYLDSTTTGSNWGIYHRQIDNPAAIKGLPANSIAFVGGGASKLQAYVCLGDGSAFFAGNASIAGMLKVDGGVEASGKLRAVGNAGVLDVEGRDHAYIQLFPMRVSAGRKGWIGYGNTNTTLMSITNEVGELQLNSQGVRVSGALSTPAGLIFEGTVPHIERDGALYRHTDGQCYLTVDDNLYIRDLGSGAGGWAAHFDTNKGSLELKGNLGVGTSAAPRGRLDVPTGDAWVGQSLNISAASDGTNAGVLNLHNETNKKLWHITLRAGEADKLIFWRNDASAAPWLATLKLGMDGVVEAPGGAVLNAIGIGTQLHGKTDCPYETIQMHPAHNLRICFGTTQRFILQNNGRFDAGSVALWNSDIYFTNTEHNHTGDGNAAGHAAIENAKDYDSLMILGRAGTSVGRKVRLWDYLKVEGVLANLSDATTKQDIASLEYGLAEVMKLRPIAFNWIDRPNPHKTLGLVGQEVREVIKEVVYDDDGQVSISYLALVPVLINAIKDLDRKIEALSSYKKDT